MRILALAALTMVTALGAGHANAQGGGGRIGHGGPTPGASYPAPGAMPAWQQPSSGVPVNAPPPPSASTNMPQRPYPGQMNGPHPNEHGARPGQGGWQGGSWQGGNRQGGTWQGGGSRWGGSVGGHWSGGMNAPGGWNAYRRPSRGYRLPSYWISPDFYVGDYGGYGLYAPPQGYGWQRYYDDAVLVDERGRVRDTVYGLDWDGGWYGDGGYSQGGSGYGYPPPYQPLPPVVQNGTVTTYSTSGYAGGGYAGGYYYPGSTTTVVTIQGAPSVTTTTTEYVEETTTRYIAPRRVYRAKRRVYRPARCSCRRAAPVEKPILGS